MVRPTTLCRSSAAFVNKYSALLRTDVTACSPAPGYMYVFLFLKRTLCNSFHCILHYASWRHMEKKNVATRTAHTSVQNNMELRSNFRSVREKHCARYSGAPEPARADIGWARNRSYGTSAVVSLLLFVHIFIRKQLPVRSVMAAAHYIKTLNRKRQHQQQQKQQ